MNAVIRDAEAQVLADLRALKLPAEDADRLVVQSDEDAAGDPVIRVWVIVPDEALRKPQIDARLDELEQHIRDVAWGGAWDYWVSVRFRSASEQADIEKQEQLERTRGTVRR